MNIFWTLKRMNWSNLDLGFLVVTFMWFCWLGLFMRLWPIVQQTPLSQHSVSCDSGLNLISIFIFFLQKSQCDIGVNVIDESKKSNISVRGQEGILTRGHIKRPMRPNILMTTRLMIGDWRAQAGLHSRYLPLSITFQNFSQRLKETPT